MGRQAPLLALLALAMRVVAFWLVEDGAFGSSVKLLGAVRDPGEVPWERSVQGFALRISLDGVCCALLALIALKEARDGRREEALRGQASTPPPQGASSDAFSAGALRLWCNPVTILSCGGGGAPDHSAFEHAAILGLLLVLQHGAGASVAVVAACAVLVHIDAQLFLPVVLLSTAFTFTSRRRVGVSKVLGVVGLGAFFVALLALKLYEGALSLSVPAAAYQQPGSGFLWYLLSESFTQVRWYFMIVCLLHPYVHVLPLMVRLHERPMEATLVMAATVLAFRPEPRWADAALFLSVASVCTRVVRRMRRAVVLAAGASLAIAVAFLPAAWHVWLEDSTGNANFLFSAAGFYSLGLMLAILEYLAGVVKGLGPPGDPEPAGAQKIQ